MTVTHYLARALRLSSAAAWLALWALAPGLPAGDPEAAIEKLRPKNLGTLELKLNPSVAAIRSDAPFSIELDLESTFSELIDGKLELAFVDDGNVRLRLQSAPLAVPNGHQSFRLFLPAMAADEDRATFVVRAVLQSRRGPLDLGTHDLAVPLKGQRQFLLAAAGLGDDTINRLTRSLALDAFRPPDAARSILLTLPVALDLRAVPLGPMGLYPFDVVVVAGEYFSQLSARQLDTIADWVETGGGVVVVPSGVLTPAHVAFLERLAGRDAKAPRFPLDRFGRLPPRKAGSKNWLTACRHGYGRALILRAMPSFGSDGTLAGVAAGVWTRAVCFLWNVRPEQTAAILKAGNWQLLAPSTNDEPALGVNLPGSSVTAAPRTTSTSSVRRMYGRHFGDYDERAPLHPQKLAQADALFALLFPEDVRVVPFRVVAAILTLFLLAIAPADYFLLGLVRRRRYTWFLFPALCLVFTVATVLVARYYTGTIDHRGALVIVDVGEKGKLLRTTRIEHIITAGSRPITTDIKEGLFARTDVQPLQSDDALGPKIAAPAPAGNAGAFRDTFANDPLDYSGTVPSSFHVTRLSRQWTPSMARVTTAGAPSNAPSLPWLELESLDAATEPGRKAIVDRLRRAVPECDILFLTPSGKPSIDSKMPTTGQGGRLGKWSTVLATLSERTEGRLFALVSRISPNGAGDLEDLSVLDAADRDSCLLHVAIPRGDDLLVYRRLLQPTRRLDLDEP